MHTLIVAHPDDEVIFFAPERYDEIIIVFLHRMDKQGFGEQRLRALANHPLKGKVTCLGYSESNYWRNPKMEDAYNRGYRDLCVWLKQHRFFDEVTTHGADGEYGHADHTLVHRAVHNTLKCVIHAPPSLEGRDEFFYQKIKDVYKKENCWTWNG